MMREKAKGGRQHELILEDQLLMAFEYLSAYRIYFRIAGSHGVRESSAYKTVKWVEDVLIKQPIFSLSGQTISF